MKNAVLLIQCPDHPGIVAQVSNWVCAHAGNIIQSDQYSTHHTEGTFFMRLVIAFTSEQNQAALAESFTIIADQLKAVFRLVDADQPLRMGILVSGHDHCLVELLYQWHSGELHVDIPFIISNHAACASLAIQFDIPYHHLPISKATKSEQEHEILALASEQSDFLVLARYMQILSPAFLATYQKDVINIHHSFLPSFMGANPYQQAYDRGVKLIGATAHYVTNELDEGPIIEQKVERVSHRDSVTALKRKGKHLEKQTLANAVEAHIQHRVFRDGQKTVVFQ